MGNHEIIGCKDLFLITPERAQGLGLDTEEPVLTSFGDSSHHIYQVNEIIEASRFDPRSRQSTKEIVRDFAVLYSKPRGGLGYFKAPAEVMTNRLLWAEVWSNIALRRWLAIVEPQGEIIKHADDLFTFDHITDRLKVLEIQVYCSDCQAGPLKEGRIMDIHGNGYLFAACDQKISQGHDKEFPGFRFNVGADGRINFEGIAQWELSRRKN